MGFFIYIAIVSTLGCILVAYDRISAAADEKIRLIRTLAICALAVIGGALPMLLLMLALRYMTRNTRLMVLVSFAAVIWLVGYLVAMVAFL